MNIIINNISTIRGVDEVKRLADDTEFSNY